MAMVFTISKSAGYERFNVNGVNKDEAKTFYRGLGLQPNPDNPGVYSIRLITDDRTQIINGPEIKITARSEFRKPTDEDLKKFFERVQTVVAGLPGDLKKITVSYQLQAQREVVEHFGLIDDVVMSVLETYDRRGFMVGEEIGGVDGQPSRTQYWINPEATGFRFKALLELIAKNLNLQSGAFEAIDDQAVADILNPDTEEPEPVLMVQDTQGWQLLMEEYQKIDNERIVRQEVRGRGRKNLIDKPESDISRIAREASKSVFYVDASAIMKGSDQADQLVKELAQLTNLGAKVVLYHLEKADTNQVFYARLKSFPRGTFVERVGSFAEVLNETRQGYSEFNLIKYETDSKFEGANAESFPSVGDRLLTISGNSGAGIYSLRALAALKLKKSIPDLGIEYRKGFHFIADGQSAASALLLTARFAVAFATSA